MDPISLIVGGGWIISALAVIGLAIPLLRGAVRPNGLYGVRFPASFKSDDAWYAINRYGAKRLLIWAIPMLLTGVTALCIPLKKHLAVTWILGFAPIAFLLIAAAQSWKFARRFERSHSEHV